MSTMLCGLCKDEVKPLDAHMGRLNGSLDVFHIDCWNKFREEKLRKKQEEDDIFNLLQGMNPLLK